MAARLFHGGWWLAAGLFLAVLGGGGLAAEEAEADASVAMGRINVRRVNLRAGPGTEFEIVSEAFKNEPVRVFAGKDGWYRIAFPTKRFASANKEALNELRQEMRGVIVLVDAEETALRVYVHRLALEMGDWQGEHPLDGVKKTVIGHAKLSCRPWATATEVGEVAVGDEVVLRERVGKYYAIDPPAKAFAYVMADYVDVTDQGPVPADVRPPPPLPPPVEGVEVKTPEQKRREFQEVKRQVLNELAAEQPILEDEVF